MFVCVCFLVICKQRKLLRTREEEKEEEDEEDTNELEEEFTLDIYIYAWGEIGQVCVVLMCQCPS